MHSLARTALRIALERGNLIAAEFEARLVDPLDLAEALELTALVASRNRRRGGRFAVRWLHRWLEEDETPSLDQVTISVACLAALGGDEHERALGTLRQISSAWP